MVGTLLSLVSSLLGGASSKNERLAQERYDEKVSAWEREQKQIEAANKRRQDTVARRRTMASAIGAPGGIMPAKRAMLGLDKPEYEESDNAESLANWSKYMGMASGFADSYPQGTSFLSGLAQETEDIPLLGSLTNALANDTPDANLGAVNSAGPQAAESSYEYTKRYDPGKTYLTKE